MRHARAQPEVPAPRADVYNVLPPGPAPSAQRAAGARGADAGTAGACGAHLRTKLLRRLRVVSDALLDERARLEGPRGVLPARGGVGAARAGLARRGAVCEGQEALRAEPARRDLRE